MRYKFTNWRLIKKKRYKKKPLKNGDSKKGESVMDMSDKMEKYLNKKQVYKPVDTIDNVFSKAIDQADKDQAKYSKEIDKMLIRDGDGRIHELTDVQIIESEDGVGTMTYTAMHPHGGEGRQGYNKGKRKKRCPWCGKHFHDDYDNDDDEDY